MKDLFCFDQTFGILIKLL